MNGGRWEDARYPLPSGKILWEMAARRWPPGVPGAGIELDFPDPGTPNSASVPPPTLYAGAAANQRRGGSAARGGRTGGRPLSMLGAAAGHAHFRAGEWLGWRRWRPIAEVVAVAGRAVRTGVDGCRRPALFSSGFVESEEYNPENMDIRFDVASVLKELKRGKRLVCNFCRKKGATVGCEERACRRSYHYFCALCDDAAIETDEVNGVYRVFCPKHDPGNRTNHCGAASKRRRHALKPSTITEQVSTEETAEENSLRILKRKNNRHKVRIDFLRKCKQAGLLDDIFEEMLDTLHLAQEKLMDDNTSETEYEETVMSLFDCGLFENILTNIHSGTEEKIQELLESRKRLDNKIELLQDLKEVILPTQENTASTSSTVSD
ncbi:PHD finger protein 11 isoform X1 [Chroicocephalus ridibundus]